MLNQIKGFSFLKTPVRLLMALIVGAVIWSSPWATCSATATPNKEYRVKAAFICNFIRFIDWPPNAFGSPKEPLRIGIIGENKFGNAFSPFIKKGIMGRPVVVERYQSIPDNRPPHLVYFSRNGMEAIGKTLQSYKTFPTLTVGEQDGFARHGGMINFILKNNRIRFEINPDKADRAGLKISAKLLNLAIIVN